MTGTRGFSGRIFRRTCCQHQAALLKNEEWLTNCSVINATYSIRRRCYVSPGCFHVIRILGGMNDSKFHWSHIIASRSEVATTSLYKHHGVNNRCFTHLPFSTSFLEQISSKVCGRTIQLVQLYIFNHIHENLRKTSQNASQEGC
jgi:hypothetical protein